MTFVTAVEDNNELLQHKRGCSVDPLIDGTTYLSTLSSVPSWSHAYFTSKYYQKLAGIDCHHDAASEPSSAGMNKGDYIADRTPNCSVGGASTAVDMANHKTSTPWDNSLAVNLTYGGAEEGGDCAYTKLCCIPERNANHSQCTSTNMSTAGTGHKSADRTANYIRPRHEGGIKGESINGGTDCLAEEDVEDNEVEFSRVEKHCLMPKKSRMKNLKFDFETNSIALEEGGNCEGLQTVLEAKRISIATDKVNNCAAEPMSPDFLPHVVAMESDAAEDCGSNTAPKGSDKGSHAWSASLPSIATSKSAASEKKSVFQNDKLLLCECTSPNMASTGAAAAIAQRTVPHGDKEKMGTPGAAAAGEETAARAANVCESATSGYVEEPASSHMLHETLTSRGGVSSIQYFLSCPSESTVYSLPPSISAAGASSRHENQGRQQCETLPEQLLVLCHVGRRLCGHKGVIHGGFIATLFDNAMGFLAQYYLLRGATVSLSIRYLKPLLADATVLVVVEEDSKIRDHNAVSTGIPTTDRSSSSNNNFNVHECTINSSNGRFNTDCNSDTSSIGTCVNHAMNLPQNKLSSIEERSSSCCNRRSRQQLRKWVSKGSMYALIPDSCRNMAKPRASAVESVPDTSVKRRFPQQHQEGDGNSSDVWLVATAEAVFVDVSDKWHWMDD